MGDAAIKVESHSHLTPGATPFLSSQRVPQTNHIQLLSTEDSPQVFLQAADLANIKYGVGVSSADPNQFQLLVPPGQETENKNIHMAQELGEPRLGSSSSLIGLHQYADNCVLLCTCNLFQGLT